MTGDMETSLAIAQEMLEDEVANRQGAYYVAVWMYSQIKKRNGEAREAYDYLATVMPNVHEPGLPAPLRTVQNRPAMFDLWAAVLPQEEVNEKLDAVIELASRVGFRPEDDPDLYIRAMALTGKIDEAIEFGLEHLFSQPYAAYIFFRFDFEEDAFVPLAADPRVQAELVRLEQEEADARDAVVQYLANRN